MMSRAQHRGPMIRRWFVLISLVSVAGCGKVHLGADHGQRYRAVFAAQAAREGAEGGGADADDARRTLARRHGPVASPAGAVGLGAGAGALIDASLGAGAAGTGAASAGYGADGNPNPIRLQGK
jgi:hypothetical protein